MIAVAAGLGGFGSVLYVARRRTLRHRAKSADAGGDCPAPNPVHGEHVDHDGPRTLAKPLSERDMQKVAVMATVIEAGVSLGNAMSSNTSIAQYRNMDKRNLIVACAKRFLTYKSGDHPPIGLRLPSIVSSWEKHELSGREAKEASEAHMIGMTVGTFLDQPIFTHFVECTTKGPRPDEIFYRDDKMLIIPNNKSFMRSKDGAAAAMSKVHFLIIPVQRIYNCVTLTKEHVPLIREMVRIAKEVYTSEKVTEYYAKQIRGFREMGPMVRGKGQLQFFCHPHPLHSVGHLHVHGCLVNEKMWSKRGNEINEMAKNIPIDVVLDCVEADSVSVADSKLSRSRNAPVPASVLEEGEEEDDDDEGEGDESDFQMPA